jgi:CRISPR/Cas system-associated endonuclease Cas1
MNYVTNLWYNFLFFLFPPMLSYPDYANKQLVIMTATDYKKLSLESDTILIKDEDDNLITKHSCHKIFCLMVIGDISITTKLLDEFARHQIILTVLSSYNLKIKTTIGHALEGNYLLRGYQYTMTDESNLILARALVSQKIAHQRHLLNQIREKSPELKHMIKHIDEIAKKISLTESSDSLR